MCHRLSSAILPPTMSDVPPVARRVLSLSLVLALLATFLPATILAQDADPLGVSDVFAVEGDSASDDVVYSWTITEPDVHWRLEATRPAEDERIAIDLRDADGAISLRSDGKGRAALFDLALQPGDYTIRVGRSGEGSPPFMLASSREATRYDPEPNDRPEQAVPIAPGAEIDGRLARISSDEDYFALLIPAGEEGLRDVTLTSSSERDRELCLLDGDGARVQCRRAVGQVGLPDLFLAPGTYLLNVRGSVDELGSYRLNVGEPRQRAIDGEAEPNDAFATASAFDAETGVKGRSNTNDHDFHVVTIEGEPQLWQVRASGPQIDQLSLTRGRQDEVARSQPGGDGSDAVLDDLVLAPGDHVFRVRTRGGDYAIEMTPLGPPDPEAEREPNNDPIRAEAYGIGERKTGRLPTDEDVDYFRFTLAAPDHLRLTLDQPDDAGFDVTLTSGGLETLKARAADVGESIDLDLALLPGDYLLRVRPQQPSEGTYELTSERLDPFALAVDQEPNDDVATAWPAPGSLVLTGDQAAGGTDVDWFELPALSEPSTVTIHHSDARPVVRLFAGTDAAEKLQVERLEDGLLTSADAPAGLPLYLQLETKGPYEVRLEAPGWSTIPEPVDPAAELVLGMEHDSVAAYWPEGQRVDGRVAITNTGPDDLELVLETTTSHYAWEVIPATHEVSVAASATVEVPVRVDIQPDAWADAPVRISALARTAEGGGRSAAVVMDALRDAPAVGSHTAWLVPDALLGGLNVAGLALGGEPMGLIDYDRELFLFDDVTPTGAGFGKGSQELPTDLAVDLAGESPVPVAGIILNPLARSSQLAETIEDFELLLSTNGEDWTTVLTGELEPLPIDQAFVLDQPVAASHAMLRVHSLHRGRSKTVALGEWKVIAEPGAVPDPMPDNIAAPVRGGHVARHAPNAGSWQQWYGMLDEVTKRLAVSFKPELEDELEIIIGFQEGRAAQITGLRWLDPDGSDEQTRVDAVDVEVGLNGPLGPWQGLGTWTFERRPDGSVVPFDLDEPTWARFVRLTAPLPTEKKRVEFPATVEVIERATDDEYRSILGEWGYTSNRGPYEWLVPTAFSEVELGPDAGDTAKEATPLAIGSVRADQAEILEDIDWYRLEVPRDHNTLGIDVEGLPTVGVRLSLFDAGGQPHEMRSSLRPGGAVHYEAVVEPGAAYDLLVEQPPFNAAFTFDTSGSMGPFLDFVLEGMREFASDVEPGREVAHIIPVSQPPLLEAWSDQPIHLENAVNNFVPQGDAKPSNVELGLLASSELLRERDGTRAILVVADAETGSLDLANDVWAALDDVQPTIYTVHVGASGHPEETRNLMRAWSDSNGGVYSYPTTHAEMDRSFERMSTRLRRPATYTLLLGTTEVNRDPASLSVSAPVGQPTALAPGVAVGIILDTSGSMRKGLDGKRRIDIAKSALRQLVGDGLAEGVPVALRTFGGRGSNKASRCETRLAQPLEPLDRAAALKLVKKLKAARKTKTPIGAALRAMADDLAAATGSHTIVLITDGAETCGDDPDAAVAELRASGVDVNLNIVGFALDDEELKAQMAAWAEAGAGSYFDAASATELGAALAVAVAAPFRVYASGADQPLASGTVGGGAVTLEPGNYRVEVLTDPIIEFDGVVLGGGEVRSLELPVTEE